MTSRVRGIGYAIKWRYINDKISTPLIYELDESLKPIKNYYLGDPDEIKRATETVARQGKARCFSSLYSILCGMNFEDT